MTILFLVFQAVLNLWISVIGRLEVVLDFILVVFVCLEVALDLRVVVLCIFGLEVILKRFELILDLGVPLLGRLKVILAGLVLVDFVGSPFYSIYHHW